MNMLELIVDDRYEYLVLGIDFVLVVLLLTSVGKMTGVIANVNSVSELSSKDNHAFGISYAGATLALGIMMTGAVSGEATVTLVYEALIVGAYGVLGIGLMASTRFLLDRVSLPKMSIHQNILDGNVAAGIIDAANMIATAIIVRAVMIWVDTESFGGLLIVLAGFITSQLLLVLVTRYRVFVYGRRHPGEHLREAFEGGNVAIAIRYFGQKIGVALAVTAASGIAVYTEGLEIQITLVWALVSLGMTVFLSVLSIAARHVILRNIDVVQEVDQQRNVGVGLIEAAIYVANGFLLIALFGVTAS